MHPVLTVYLEHDGKVLLVNSEGLGPQQPQQGRLSGEDSLRFPTQGELVEMGIDYVEKERFRIKFGPQEHTVVKANPKIPWPEHWAWKDACIADNAVHPVAREAVYRSIHRLVSKVMIQNNDGHVLMGKVERGHFNGFWTLPGGYMDHNEHPAVGCVRETFEELGLEIVLETSAPVITQRVFNEDGISFVSFTYRSTWNGDLADLKLQVEEISEVRWFDADQAFAIAVSQFDKEALRTLL